MRDSELIVRLAQGEPLRRLARLAETNPSAIYRRVRALEKEGGHLVRRRHRRSTPEERRKIRQLLLAGRSRSEVARITGFSKATVSRIGSGRRRGDLRRLRSRTRCQHCGAAIRLLPCLACRTRQRIA